MRFNMVITLDHMSMFTDQTKKERYKHLSHINVVRQDMQDIIKCEIKYIVYWLTICKCSLNVTIKTNVMSPSHCCVNSVNMNIPSGYVWTIKINTSFTNVMYSTNCNKSFYKKYFAIKFNQIIVWNEKRDKSFLRLNKKAT